MQAITELSLCNGCFGGELHVTSGSKRSTFCRLYSFLMAIAFRCAEPEQLISVLVCLIRNSTSDLKTIRTGTRDDG